jgi:glycosyltransferase involved in cell wall biosynthesis
MACGVPVIATAVGGNLDMVDHNVTGLLVPPRSPKQLGDLIVAMTSLALRRRLGAAAQRSVADRFSFDKCVDNYAALYRSVA